MSDVLKTATKRFARYMVAYRNVFTHNGFQNEMQVVVAHEADSINVVMERIQKHAPPVVIAVHFPERAAVNEFTVIHMTPSSVTAASAEAGEEVVGTSTIGMFADNFDGEKAGRVFPFTVRKSWQHLEARSFAHS